MRTEIQFPEYGEGSYLPLGDGDRDAVGIESDDLRLRQLGYKQELNRSLSYEFHSKI